MPPTPQDEEQKHGPSRPALGEGHVPRLERSPISYKKTCANKHSLFGNGMAIRVVIKVADGEKEVADIFVCLHILFTGPEVEKSLRLRLSSGRDSVPLVLIF